jgi:monoterpene epsilon-lactone hydrolase
MEFSLRGCRVTCVRTGLVVLALAALAAAQSLPSRDLPARRIPVPTTVSPELQKVIAPAWTGNRDATTFTTQQWKAFQKSTDDAGAKALQPLKQRLHVTVEEQKIAGVRVYRVKPEAVVPENRSRLLVHVHGGAYVIGGGEAAAAEAVLMAAHGKVEVISVDYRMPPDFPFPAALDDTVAVWKDVIKTHPPGTVGLFGTSTGGGMTLATVLRLKELGLPRPGAIMAGTPWSDLTKTGDTYFTNEYVDNVLGSADGLLQAAAKLYAGTHGLKEPLLSPIYGDFSGFPPAILLSGTRDLFLSNTVRTHQKLLQSGNVAELLVFEGQSHAQYYIASDAPESAAAFKEVAQFFDRHLKK